MTLLILGVVGIPVGYVFTRFFFPLYKKYLPDSAKDLKETVPVLVSNTDLGLKAMYSWSYFIKLLIALVLFGNLALVIVKMLTGILLPEHGMIVYSIGFIVGGIIYLRGEFVEAK